MSENPRQFISLDYANADLYGALLDRPSPATPLNLPLEDFSSKPPSTNLDPLQQAFMREERARTDALFKEQREAQLAKEQALLEREVERNLRLQKIPSVPPEAPAVNNRSYESQYDVLPRSEAGISSPSTGSPPPTAGQSNSRASALVEPTATPAPALLKEALPPAAAAGAAAVSLPKALPQAAGRAVVPGIAAAFDFGVRVAAGQPITQAASGAGAGLAGAGIGFAVGNAVVPGIGGVVGMMVGGYVGGLISDSFFRGQLPTPASPPAEPVNYPPFRGAVGFGVWNAYYKFDEQERIEGHYIYANDYSISGRIISSEFLNWNVYDAGAGQMYGWTNYRVVYETDAGETTSKVIRGETRLASLGKPVLLGFIKMGTNPNDPPEYREGYRTPPPDNRPPTYNEPPLNEDNRIPTGLPASTKKGKLDDVAPSKKDGGNQRWDNGDWIPGGFLAPSKNPSPDHNPSNLGGNLPDRAPAPAPPPKPFAEPQDVPYPRNGSFSTPSTGGLSSVTPSSGGVVGLNPVGSTPSEGTDSLGNYHDGKGGYFDPSGKPIPRGDVGSRDSSPPTGSGETKRGEPIPDSVSPYPKKQGSPSPKNAENTSNDDLSKELDKQRQEFDKQLKKLNDLALLIGGIGTAITQIPGALNNSPTYRQGRREDIQNAVCDISQPGACLGSQIQRSVDAANANGNRLDQLNAALNTGNLGANAQLLAGQATILERLGPQIPGGLSGKLQRLAKWLHLDRALNILIWWQTLHNAYMLSANLGQTLTSAISNVLAAIGIEDAEGSPLDIGAILGGQFDSLAKTVIGESEWGGIKAEFKKWNRIYQAAANLMNSVQSIGYSILSALEVVGSWVALIGNGLKKWGEISEKAYRWMNPTPNFQNKFFTALENTENVVSQIDVVASEVLSVQDTVNQIGEQKEQFTKALGEQPQSKQGTIPPEATQVKAGFEASKLVSATGLAMSDEDKEADE
ncbi:hypothetical protein NIES25_44210 [Nostoc linckia NIES-25]|nr:hypothetical protein NIES25_44210 [Nostoc linckia NIES-25]